MTTLTVPEDAYGFTCAVRFFADGGIRHVTGYLAPNGWASPATYPVVSREEFERDGIAPLLAYFDDVTRQSYASVNETLGRDRYPMDGWHPHIVQLRWYDANDYECGTR